MIETSVSQQIPKTAPAVTMEFIMKALYNLPPEDLPAVLQFIEFLEYKSNIIADNRSEDEALWDAVQANQRYKAEHPNEELERYTSGKEFLNAVADL